MVVVIWMPGAHSVDAYLGTMAVNFCAISPLVE